MAFGRDVELTVVRTGDVLTLYPTKDGVTEMLARLTELPGLGDVQARDPVEPPTRIDD